MPGSSRWALARVEKKKKGKEALRGGDGNLGKKTLLVFPKDRKEKKKVKQKTEKIVTWRKQRRQKKT